MISALFGEGDAVLMDRLNHASLIDAAKLSRARLFVYSHRSVESLDRVLRRTRSYRKRLVVTDSLFSMDGDFAPLKEIREICSRENVWLMIDDAHATGVLGKNGTGLAEHFGLLGKIEIVMGTLSKALGSQGGFVCGSQDLIQHLVNRARPFIYTTALAPSACAAAIASLDLVQKEPQKRRYLLSLSQTLRKGLKNIFPDYSTDSLSPKGRALKDESPKGGECFASSETSSPPKRFASSQIVPWVAGSSEQALKVALTLRSAGIYAPAIRPPTVPQGESRLRFSLTSEHTQSDIQRLISCISN
ncbi:MAG: aminotransferase class I/II-fold pyridoxal phosphate-dependent enzyme [Elusimicrobia bacterium]|nr:aminotransferase class I/II-fold pyridoxal phosphate-dependent enzyme [Elusimicrobiota bacterium]